MAGTLGNLSRWLFTPCVVSMVFTGLSGCAGDGIATARSLRADGEGRESLEILTWQAGRDIPPGLSAARTSELEAARKRALERLRKRDSGADRRQLESWLTQPDMSEELWCAAAR